MLLLIHAALLSSGAIATAPLCRDTKGLYTPCPPGAGQGARAPARGVAPAPSETTRPAPAEPVAPDPGSPAASPASPVSSDSTPATAASAPPATPAAAPGRRHRARLCRDGKGLMKPC